MPEMPGKRVEKKRTIGSGPFPVPGRTGNVDVGIAAVPVGRKMRLDKMSGTRGLCIQAVFTRVFHVRQVASEFIHEEFRGIKHGKYGLAAGASRTEQGVL